jgi:type VI secretion system protein ImpE
VEALELFRAGKLNEAIDACAKEVQQHPAQADPRDLLSQLLCFAGEFERADKQLEVLGTQFADRGPAIALIRQLIRAAEARQQFFEQGRLPEFLTEPADYIRRHVEASICIRQGELGEAAKLLEQAEEARPHPSGRCNGSAFHDFRDADDTTSSFFEAFTTTGKYFWVPFERIHRITLHPAESPLDILWRRCQIAVQGSPAGIMYLPQLYVGSSRSEDETIRVGKSTEWLGSDGEPVRGIGHRILAVDDEARPLVNIDSLEFDPAPSADQ